MRWAIWYRMHTCRPWRWNITKCCNRRIRTLPAFAAWIGKTPAIGQGAPLMTVDYDFWVHLPERHYVRLLVIVQRLRCFDRAMFNEGVAEESP